MNSITIVPDRFYDLWELRFPSISSSAFYIDYSRHATFVYTMQEKIKEHIGEIN